MIRSATKEDIKHLIPMGEKFFYHSGYEDVTKLSVESLDKTFTHLIDDDNGILLVDDDLSGMIGALLYPFYFNHEHLTGQELFWWVDPSKRKSSVGKDLLKAAQDEAKAKGAKSFTMIALESLTPELVGNIYLNQGYRKSEHSYIRKL
jgi:hypothetical protein